MTTWATTNKSSTTFANGSKSSTTFSNGTKTVEYSHLLMEGGDTLLLEIGDKIRLELARITAVWTNASKT